MVLNGRFLVVNVKWLALCNLDTMIFNGICIVLVAVQERMKLEELVSLHRKTAVAARLRN